MSFAERSRSPAEIDFAVGRLINTTNTAEGAILPPAQKGEFRIPFVTNLQLVKTISYFGSTQFTLTWIEPDSPQISHFNIYVYGLLTNNRQALGPSTVTRSPAEVRVGSRTAVTVTFVVQTVLKNGQVSDLERSPSVSGMTVAGSLTPSDFTAATIPVTAIQNGIAGELITWDAAGVVDTIGPGAADEILVGSGAGAVPQFKSRSTLDLVQGRSNLTNDNAITKNHATNGTITESALFDDATQIYTTNRNVGIGTATPGTLFHVQQGTLGNEVARLASTATNDDPAERVYQNRVATTDASVTTLHTFTIPVSTTYAIDAVVVARRTGGAAGTAEDGACYRMTAVYKNVAGTATIIGTDNITADEDQAGWNAVFTVSSGTVLLEVTGAVDNNITWHVTAKTHQVST